MLITHLNITTYVERSEVVVQGDADYFWVIHGLKKVGNHCSRGKDCRLGFVEEDEAKIWIKLLAKIYPGSTLLS